MENYFSIKKYFSNSFLSKINAEINGNPMPFADASFYSFGREFEDCLLYSNNTQNDMVRAMVMATIKNDTYKRIISNNRLKIQHEWYGNFMGLPSREAGTASGGTHIHSW